MSRFRLSKAASEDLVAIYIQSHDLFGPRQADHYQDELEALFRRLADAPGMARLRLELAPPTRVFSYKAHVILYDQEPEGVIIQRVRHGAENWIDSPQADANDGDST
ncbi:MAG: type II toxin-antitoxin system RelE/ParE family toxin [Alphaproteobacteria bacterium]|jgi:toxin ParE1/3/4|uniref:type II toxin-antitoxin system RelE/ParE family toxin n=1 Tax=Brevundimonas sp. TaxID=1871086 RepID=UPI001E104142|nr:type II toxin-antitoxin system RelE/ParE family toxin [Alphaproteobacteria bacterium]MBU1520716.1 type II toxin-antitoxin system RelE/ParE family toxin [Alphaproteobacteria bacterium]MBU2030143.1 type II toxin-antitoxin system RelE/ParE family toxin [Alphaproteobacteria bacterium]MBU2163193.1 type II toxin-antitoxin system RelE/ParE family toxin [Alphaproteobacteria bacterium]MBU2231330.1 type II toxin-antitoxin system RelE/ParE family toxin [Alphaproteobacteria bacterium]